MTNLELTTQTAAWRNVTVPSTSSMHYNGCKTIFKKCENTEKNTSETCYGIFCTKSLWKILYSISFKDVTWIKILLRPPKCLPGHSVNTGYLGLCSSPKAVLHCWFRIIIFSIYSNQKIASMYAKKENSWDPVHFHLQLMFETTQL